MEEIISLAGELISCRSYNQENVNQAMEKAAYKLTSWGIKPEIYMNQGYKMLTASIGSGNKTIILNGHLDVVPGEEEQFTPKVVDGRMYGRGSYDMLCAVSAMMFALRELSKVRLNTKLTLMLVPTEETDGEIGTKFLIDNGITGDFAICGEPTNLNTSIMSKGVLQIKISSYGISTHGSRPWLGDNAISKAFEIFKKITTLPFTKVKNDYFNGPSINLGKIRGGDVVNRVPDVADIEIDIRFLPGQNLNEIVNEIKSIDNSMKVDVLKEGIPVVTDPNNQYMKALIDITDDMGIKSNLIAQHGSADTRFFQGVGIPSIEFGPIGANHHGANEYVDIGSLITYKNILVNYIKTIGDGGENSKNCAD